MSRITAVKKSSLADLSEGWGEECYAYVRPASYDDMVAVDDAKISEKSPREQAEFQKKFVTDHWLSGKIKIFEGGQFVEADMEIDDCFAYQAITDKLYLDIMGVDLDPKDLAALTAANAMSAELPKSGVSTRTLSSEATPRPATALAES